MKIPIKDAINSGAWYRCQGQLSYYLAGSGYSGPIDLKINVISFDKITLSEIDELSKVDTTEYNLEGGDFWLLKVQVVSLTKKKASGNWLADIITIVDQDDYEFTRVNDWHLTYESKYAVVSGLKALRVDWTPKIKYNGALAYFLPKEDTAEYYLSVQGGNIQEV